MKLEKLEYEVLRFVATENGGQKVWYWQGADQFEKNPSAEQEKYGETKYNRVIENLEERGLITAVHVKGASNAEYYRVTRKGWKELKEMEMTPRSRFTLESRRRTMQLKKEVKV